LSTVAPASDRHEAREVLEVAPKLKQFLRRAFDRKRFLHVNAAIEILLRRRAITLRRIDAHRLVHWTMPGGGAVHQRAAEYSQRRSAERAPSKPQQHQPAAGHSAEPALVRPDINLRLALLLRRLLLTNRILRHRSRGHLNVE
jgi:hypothetical protein